MDKQILFQVYFIFTHSDMYQGSSFFFEKCVFLGVVELFGTCFVAKPSDSYHISFSNTHTHTHTHTGTSMAAPHVAGVMAKYLTNENLTPAAMKTKLKQELDFQPI